MKKRVCVITAGHLSTSPRMLKAADALHEAGYQMRVICTNHVQWAKSADAETIQKRSWKPIVIDYDRRSASLTYFYTGVRFHAAQRLAGFLTPARSHLLLAMLAYGRVHSEMYRTAIAEPVDLLYGGTTGGIPVVAAAARRLGVPYALDLEDFHSAEQADSPSATLAHGLARRIEQNILPGATFLTAAGRGVASAYKEAYRVNPIPINNVFSLPPVPPNTSPGAHLGLRLYWFSQTIGPRRGLEDAINAMGIAQLPGELHLRGNAIPDYLASLRALGQKNAPHLKIVHHEPASPDEMGQLAQDYDIGLALEQPYVHNSQVCLSNKVFTYMLAGLAVVFSDTVGQRPIADDMGEGAFIYSPGDITSLASWFRVMAADKSRLAHAKQTAWDAAKRRWHWDHAEEKGALLAAIERTLR